MNTFDDYMPSPRHPADHPRTPANPCVLWWVFRTFVVVPVITLLVLFLLGLLMAIQVAYPWFIGAVITGSAILVLLWIWSFVALAVEVCGENRAESVEGER